jgi:hypothetical protein
VVDSEVGGQFGLEGGDFSSLSEMAALYDAADGFLFLSTEGRTGVGDHGQAAGCRAGEETSPSSGGKGLLNAYEPEPITC